MICTRMGRPEGPVMSWSGEALLRTTAVVRAGRVVSANVRVVGGVLDGKSRRALQNAVVTTPHESYECPGDHLFEQEFHFKVEP